MAGIALASGTCFVGLGAALNSIHRFDLVSAAAGEAARRFTIVPVSGALVLAVQTLRVPVAATDAWLAICNWFASFAP